MYAVAERRCRTPLPSIGLDLGIQQIIGDRISS
jgi:hypothetical protein